MIALAEALQRKETERRRKRHREYVKAWRVKHPATLLESEMRRRRRRGTKKPYEPRKGSKIYAHINNPMRLDSHGN